MKYLSSLFFLITYIYASFIYADTVFFKNGDIVSGEITKITSENISLTPSFNTEMTLDFAHVDIKQIKTTQKVTIELDDGSVVYGKFTSGDQGHFHIQDTAQEYALSDIQDGYIGLIQAHQAFKYRGHLRGGLNVTSGNTDTKNYNLDGQLIAENHINRVTILTEQNLTEQESQRTQDRTFGSLKYDYFWSDKIFMLANGDFERDKFQDLDLRSSLGFGLGYQFYNQDDLRLSLEAGPSYVNERFSVQDRDRDYAAFRWGINYSQNIIDNLSIYHNNRGIKSLANMEDTIINARTGFNMPIIKSIRASFEWRLDWNNNPASGREAIDNSYITNLGYYF